MRCFVCCFLFFAATFCLFGSVPQDVPLTEYEWNTCIQFLHDKGMSIFDSGQTYIPQRSDVPYPLEKDPQTGSIYLHLKTKKEGFLGMGSKKIVSKSVLLGSNPVVVARCEPRVGTISPKEINILRRLQGTQGIVQLISCLHHTNGRTDLMLEYFNKGSLRSFLKKNQILSDNQLLSIFTDIIVGLQNLHTRGIFHRDICLNNILIKETNGQLRAAWTDFGWSYDTEQTPKISFSAYRPFCPPESLRVNSLVHIDIRKAEVYCLGVCLYNILRNRDPNWIDVIRYDHFAGYLPLERNLKEIIIHKMYKKNCASMREVGVKKELLLLTLKCLHPNPKKRLSLDEALLWLCRLQSGSK